jgi:hypothetical protein
MIGVFLRVFQRRCLLLYSRCSYQAVHPALCVRYLFNRLVQPRIVSNINLTIVQCCAQFFRSPLLDYRKVRGRFWQDVKCINCRAGFEKSFGLSEAEATCCTSDEDDTACEAEFCEALGGADEGCSLLFLYSFAFTG